MPATATYSLSGNAYLDSLLGNQKWAVTTLTFSFPEDPMFYGTRYGNGETLYNFDVLNSAQQLSAQDALGMVSAVSGLNFSKITESATRHADMRFAMSDLPSTAWAYFPSLATEGGDSWFNKSSGYYSSPMKGNYAHTTFLHEIGHALGLEHAHEGYAMPTNRDSMEYTVMSYRSYTDATLRGGYTNENWGYAQSLMMYDIAALQHMYGANFSTNSGNTTYSWSPFSGEMFINGVGQGAPGGNRIFMTVWDGNGTDTYDFSSYTTNLKVDLRPGGWTTTSPDQLARLHYDGSKVAVGNIANALLHDRDPRSLIENARGGDGNDTLIGNNISNVLQGQGGHDRLYGGAGADRIDGGSGIDIANYGNAAAGVLADLLYSELGTGDAAGDTYVSIERLYGSRFSDNLRGDNAANLLYGATGNDILQGRDGNDRLMGGDGHDRLYGGAGADRLEGGNGIDIANYGSATAAVLADLLYAEIGVGDAAGDTYVSIERLYGSRFNDNLRGDNAANLVYGATGHDFLYGRGGNDKLMGGDGNDRLLGGAGADFLEGGNGADTFIFQRVSDSLPNISDTISDFTVGVDRIDLRPLDADTGLVGDQMFSWLGSTGFTGSAAELTFNSGHVAGDTNGDGIADFEITVLNVAALTVDDFYL